MAEQRIKCLTPTCRRTESATKFGPDTQIVCGKCWKFVPDRLKAEYRRLRAHNRKLKRRMKAKGVENPEFPALHRRMDENWAKIRDFVQNTVKHAESGDLEAFLKEMGLD